MQYFGQKQHNESIHLMCVFTLVFGKKIVVDTSC